MHGLILGVPPPQAESRAKLNVAIAPGTRRWGAKNKGRIKNRNRIHNLPPYLIDLFFTNIGTNYHLELCAHALSQNFILGISDAQNIPHTALLRSHAFGAQSNWSPKVPEIAVNGSSHPELPLLGTVSRTHFTPMPVADEFFLLRGGFCDPAGNAGTEICRAMLFQNHRVRCLSTSGSP